MFGTESFEPASFQIRGILALPGKRVAMESHRSTRSSAFPIGTQELERQRDLGFEADHTCLHSGLLEG